MRISTGTSTRARSNALLLLALAACAVIWWSGTSGAVQAGPAAAKLDWNWDPNSAQYGPGNWRNITGYKTCGETPQSPINFTATDDKAVGAIEFEYKEFYSRVMSDGEGYKFEVKVRLKGEGGGIRIGGTLYELTDFHVHTLSEHTFGGAHADLEVHLVHKGADGSTAVVGVLMDKVGSGGNILVKDMITNAKETPKDFKVNPRLFLPQGNGVRYYSYKGSLTTPACDPVAHWMVAASPKGERPTVNESDLHDLQTFIRAFSINRATGSKYPYNHRPVQTNKVRVTVYGSK